MKEPYKIRIYFKCILASLFVCSCGLFEEGIDCSISEEKYLGETCGGMFTYCNTGLECCVSKESGHYLNCNKKSDCKSVLDVDDECNGYSVPCKQGLFCTYGWSFLGSGSGICATCDDFCVIVNRPKNGCIINKKCYCCAHYEICQKNLNGSNQCMTISSDIGINDVSVMDSKSDVKIDIRIPDIKIVDSYIPLF